MQGRKKEMIVTPDGLNVFPDDVERAVRESVGVQDAAVVGGGSAGREHVHAVLLLHPGADPDAAVRDANGRLEDHQRIRAFSVWTGPALPRTEGTQKLKRRELKRWVDGDDRPAAGASSAAAGDTVEDVVGRFAHGRQITGATTFEELGLGSLERIELALALERAFDCTIDEDALARLADVDDLRGLLAGEPRGRAATVAARTSSPDAGSETSMAFPTWSQHAAFARHPPTRPGCVPAAAHPGLCLDPGRGPRSTRPRARSSAVRRQPPERDGRPVILAALPPERRRRVATVAAREWFAPHFHPERHTRLQRIATGLAYYLGVLCFNVAPLPQREAGAREAMRHLGSLLGQGSSVLIFPEGRRRETGRIDAFQPGVGMLASRMRAPVVPVRIDGVDRVLPVGARWARPGRVRVAFGDPIRAEGRRLRGDRAADRGRRQGALIPRPADGAGHSYIIFPAFQEPTWQKTTSSTYRARSSQCTAAVSTACSAIPATRCWPS